jgi:UPF0716 protein FxsA
MIPLIEIALFARVGEAIGAFNTLLLCLLSSGFGVFILQEQGFRNLLAQSKGWAAEDDILPELFDRLCIALAGGLLVIPGFFTDAVGLLLLVPPLRTLCRRWIVHNLFGGAQYVRTTRAHWQAEERGGGTVLRSDAIDAEFERLDEPDGDGKA